MIAAKMLELRDRGTFIPLLAFRVQHPQSEGERWLLAKAGYGRTIEAQEAYVWFYAPSYWNVRTYGVAHRHVVDNWDNLNDGDVIDIEYILGETKVKKVSERVEEGVQP